MNEYFSNRMQASSQVWREICQVLQPIVDQTLVFVHNTRAALWEDYHRAGLPYGNNEAGMLRWVVEVMEVARLETQAEMIRERHQVLAETRTTFLSQSGREE